MIPLFREQNRSDLRNCYGLRFIIKLLMSGDKTPFMIQFLKSNQRFVFQIGTIEFKDYVNGSVCSVRNEQSIGSNFIAVSVLNSLSSCLIHESSA